MAVCVLSNSTQDQINDLSEAIGNTSMGTTATTLTGAIAEHESDISNLNSKTINFVDYSSRVKVASLATVNGTYTPPKAGFLYVQAVKSDDSASSAYILDMIDGANTFQVIRYACNGSTQTYQTFMIPVSPGMTLKCSTVTNMHNLSDRIWFIPLA